MMTRYRVAIPSGYVLPELFIRHRRLGPLGWSRDDAAARDRVLDLTHAEAEELRQCRGLIVTREDAPDTATTTTKATKKG